MAESERERRVRERQSGDYEPPILAEPQGGPVPPWTGDSEGR